MKTMTLVKYCGTHFHKMSIIFQMIKIPTSNLVKQFCQAEPHNALSVPSEYLSNDYGYCFKI